LVLASQSRFEGAGPIENMELGIDPYGEYNTGMSNRSRHAASCASGQVQVDDGKATLSRRFAFLRDMLITDLKAGAGMSYHLTDRPSVNESHPSPRSAHPRRETSV
jgi:hypothetical protein